mmetsp:Transcript_54079/g.143098  ORF Transcript_54079/g.143098 Transcript_54079/m.143098 type:complete len:228 (-) Transcript_54079:181-864(-)
MRWLLAISMGGLLLITITWFMPSDQMKPNELNELNFMDDYSVKTDNIERQLEKFRIERDVALTALGHPSLTEVPKHNPKWKQEQLKKLKEVALGKLERISRGRHSYSSLGLSDDDDDNLDDSSDSSSEVGDNSCSESDARIGLCGVHVPSPANVELKDKEALVSRALTAKEEKSDAARNAIIQQINKQRLQKAKKLMEDLVQTDKRINELVHHAVKVAAMAPHSPNA